jgi:hypothetical protein
MDPNTSNTTAITNLPIDNQPIDNQPIDNQPIDNQPIDNQPIDNQPIDNQPIDNKFVLKYRNLAVAFINQHKKDLASIFLQHSREAIDEDRIGVLGINLVNFDSTGKVDVAYLPVRILEPILAQQIHDRIKENEIQIIYFLMSTLFEDQLVEIDIRTLTQ